MQTDAVCERHAVPLGAAALQFPLGHPAVVSVIPGPNAPDQVRKNLQWFNHEIPTAFWNELKSGPDPSGGASSVEAECRRPTRMHRSRLSGEDVGQGLPKNAR